MRELWIYSTIEQTVGIDMGEKMKLSAGQRSLSMTEKWRRLCIKEVIRGQRTVGGGGGSPGLGSGLSLCGDRWGGDSSLGASWLLMDCWPFIPQHLVVHFWNVVASEGRSLSHPQCITGDCVPSVTLALCPTLSLLCYEASALGASFCPFFREGKSDVFTVFRGGLTGSLASSCSDGSLYIATVRQRKRLLIEVINN